MKAWYKSTTIWTNIGIFMASVVPLLASQLGDVIGVDRALQVGAVLGIINTVLQVGIRAFITPTSISRPGNTG